MPFVNIRIYEGWGKDNLNEIAKRVTSAHRRSSRCGAESKPYLQPARREIRGLEFLWSVEVDAWSFRVPRQRGAPSYHSPRSQSTTRPISSGVSCFSSPKAGMRSLREP